MDQAAARGPSPVPVSFEDGLGVRHRVVGAANEPLEVLKLRDELTAVSSFEFALRERVSRLTAFQHASYGRVRGVERLGKTASALGIVCDHVPGARLSDILSVAEKHQIPVDLNAALCLIRQLVPAVAALHEKVADVSHGALAPERVVVTPHARLVIVEHVLGAALEQLRFSQERYWKELRVAMPHTIGISRFDRRGDVLQLGALALMLILGRPLKDEEFPDRIEALVNSAWAQSATGPGEPLTAPIRTWLSRALQVDPRTSFSSAVEARTELDAALGVDNYVAEQTALEGLLTQYYKVTNADRAAAKAASLPRPTIAPAATMPAASTPATPQPPRPPAPVATTAAPAATTPPASATRVATAPSAAAPATVPQVPLTAFAPTAAPKAESIVSARVVSTTAPSAAAPKTDAAAAPAGAATALERTPSSQLETLAPVVKPADTAEVTMQKPSVQPRRWWIVAAAVVLIAVTSGATIAARWYMVPVAPVAETGTLEVNTNPVGVEVVVDGKSRGATPLKVDLAAGSHSLELVTDGDRRTIPVTITAGGQVSQYIELPETGRGRLQVRTEPAGAKVIVDGNSFGTSPVMVEGLTPGLHKVVLENAFGSLTEEVTIEAGTMASLVVPMRAPQGAVVSGWISVRAPVDVQLYEGDRLLGSSRTDRIMVAAGRHNLEIVSDALGYRTSRVVNVTPGQVASLKLDMPDGSLAINALPWAEAWVDGQRVGETPIGNVAVPLGVHEVVLRHPELGEHRSSVTVTASSPARVSVDLRKR